MKKYIWVLFLLFVQSAVSQEKAMNQEYYHYKKDRGYLESKWDLCIPSFGDSFKKHRVSYNKPFFVTQGFEIGRRIDVSSDETTLFVKGLDGRCKDKIVYMSREDAGEGILTVGGVKKRDTVYYVGEKVIVKRIDGSNCMIAPGSRLEVFGFSKDRKFLEVDIRNDTMFLNLKGRSYRPGLRKYLGFDYKPNFCIIRNIVFISPQFLSHEEPDSAIRLDFSAIVLAKMAEEACPFLEFFRKTLDCQTSNYLEERIISREECNKIFHQTPIPKKNGIIEELKEATALCSGNPICNRQKIQSVKEEHCSERTSQQ